MSHAEALLLIEADSGKVLQAENATMPWYPASVTKLMTAYVTLKAVKDGRITLDTLLTVSPVAASQSPSKMGFRPGTQVTVDNALKMMLVKSANDMAVVLAEGVGGSIDGFSAMMNEAAQRLGMTQTSYVNPNGLPADGQITSARDLAILARAIIRDLPEYEYFVHIPSIRYRPQGHAEFQQADRALSRRRRLQDRLHLRVRLQSGGVGHPQRQAADRGGAGCVVRHRCARSGPRNCSIAAFPATRLSWLRPSLGTVDNLVPIDASPPNLRDEMCGGKHKQPASDEDEETVASAADTSGSGESGMTFFAAGLQPPMTKPSELLAGPAAAFGADPGLYRPDQNRRRADCRGRRRQREADATASRKEEVAGRGEKARRRGRAESRSRRWR